MRYLSVILGLFLLACGTETPTTSLSPGVSLKDPSHIDISSIVSDENIDPKTTTLLIRRLSDGQAWVVHPERLGVRYSPASTSKIPHTLIALETGTAKPDTIFEWDGRPRTFESWNQDQTLLSAYRRSAVWVYQDIATSVGSDTLSKWLKSFNYGNHDIGEAASLTTYWLSQPLKISASEQVSFLTDFVEEKLTLSRKTYLSSKSIFQEDKEGQSILYAKTGWMYDTTKTNIGWYVGWVENIETDETYMFAFNMDIEDGSLRNKRKSVVKNALIAIGAWPNE